MWIGSSSLLLTSATFLKLRFNTRLCTATAAASMRESYGCDGQRGSYTDIDYTDTSIAQNNREAGCDGEVPGFRNHLDPVHMGDMARLWDIDHIKVPHWDEPTKGTIQMLWI